MSEYTTKKRNRSQSDSAGAQVVAQQAAEHIPNSVLQEVFAGRRHATNEMVGHRQNLAPSVQAKMSRAFGMDFSNLQVYRSDAMDGTDMRAVTQGNRVVLGSDVNLNTLEGQTVLGHEFSHVRAQSRGIGMGHSGILNDAGLEHQADVEGSMAARGLSVDQGGMSMGAGLSTGMGMSGIEGLPPIGGGISASAAAPMQAWGFGSNKPGRARPLDAVDTIEEEELGHKRGLLERNYIGMDEDNDVSEELPEEMPKEMPKVLPEVVPNNQPVNNGAVNNLSQVMPEKEEAIMPEKEQENQPNNLSALDLQSSRLGGMEEDEQEPSGPVSVGQEKKGFFSRLGDIFWGSSLGKYLSNEGRQIKNNWRKNKALGFLRAFPGSVIRSVFRLASHGLGMAGRVLAPLAILGANLHRTARSIDDSTTGKWLLHWGARALSLPVAVAMSLPSLGANGVSQLISAVEHKIHGSSRWSGDYRADDGKKKEAVQHRSLELELINNKPKSRQGDLGFGYEVENPRGIELPWYEKAWKKVKHFGQWLRNWGVYGGEAFGKYELFSDPNADVMEHIRNKLNREDVQRRQAADMQMANDISYDDENLDDSEHDDDKELGALKDEKKDYYKNFGAPLDVGRSSSAKLLDEISELNQVNDVDSIDNNDDENNIMNEKDDEK